MRQTPAEQALGRLMQYLRLAGVAASAENSASALEMVCEAVRLDEHAVIALVMDRIGERFVLPSIEVPASCPPMLRGSIGYDSR